VHASRPPGKDIGEMGMNIDADEWELGEHGGREQNIDASMPKP
jgi:hypothetical protein